MQRQSLILDCDDVLALTTNKVVDICNREYHKKVTIEDFTEWDLNKIFPDIDFKAIFARKNFYRDLEPVPDSQYYVERLLYEGYDIFIASAISIKQGTEREEWLNEYYPWLPKGSFAPIVRKDFLIGNFMLDDGLHNVQNTKCLMPVIFDRPWNRKPSQFRRVYNWKEFYELVTSFRGKER